MQNFMQVRRILLCTAIIFAACAGCAKKVEDPPPTPSPNETEIQSPDTVDTPASTQQAADTPQEEEIPAAPQDLIIFSRDGFSLEGRLYPAAKVSAPLIILYHWAPGDQEEWVEIAYWLQNRGLGGGSEFDNESPWLDAAWFPAMKEDKSFNVLTFTFRNCAGGCSKFDRENWLLDVQGVVDFAVELENVDSSRIVMIGASIGSDGAVDGCAYLQSVHPGSCLGAISLSPGNYLTLDYAEQVTQLIDVPVWCLYAEVDRESAPICSGLTADNFKAYMYPAASIFSNGHGMNLIESSQNPNPLELIKEFLNEVL